MIAAEMLRSTRPAAVHHRAPEFLAVFPKTAINQLNYIMNLSMQKMTRTIPITKSNKLAQEKRGTGLQSTALN
jgi:hypothetical protein